MRFFILLSYDGSHFFGWQRQPNKISVQQIIEEALSTLLRESIQITGAGRTDTGVHAKNYYAHFDSNNNIITKEPDFIIYKLNAILPKSIHIADIFLVPSESHARFDAISRTYKYYIHTSKDPFSLQYSYFYPHLVDIESMNDACKFLIGERDFTSLAKLHTDTKSNICSVELAKWEYGTFSTIENHKNHFVFTIKANRFLRNMVRASVGTLLEIGRGKYPINWLEEVLNKRDRCAAGNSVPSNALFLTEIEYPYSNLLKRF
jgi:tRNA pseudouridine38-40 synthase